MVVMSPVSMALDKLQGEENCFLGILMPTILEVRKKLLALSPTLTHCTILADALIHSIERRFEHLFQFDSASKVYAVAAASHPNFKLRWVPNDKKQWVKDAFIAEAIKHHKINSSVNACTEGIEPTCEDDFFNFDDDVAETTSNSEITIECLRYLEDGHSASPKVLQGYPAVRSVFRMLNATLPSSAPVERLFSKGALISVPRRNRISDKRFEQLLLLKANTHILV